MGFRLRLAVRAGAMGYIRGMTVEVKLDLEAPRLRRRLIFSCQRSTAASG